MSLRSRCIIRRTKKDEIDKDAVKWMVGKFRRAIDEALPGAKKIMDYAQLKAKKEEALSWRSPSGVKVINECREEDPKTMSLWLEVRRVEHNVVVDGPHLDRAACERAAPPTLCIALMPH